MNLRNTPEYKKAREIICNFFLENFTLEEMQNLDLNKIVKIHGKNHIEIKN